MKQPSVLFISPTAAHYIGGTETVVSQLAQHMKDRVRLTVLSGDPGTGSKPLFDIDGVEFHTLPFLGRDSRCNQLWSKLLMTSRFKIESYSFFRSLANSSIDLAAYDHIMTFYEADAYLLSRRYPSLRARCRHFLPGASMRWFFRQVPANQVFFFGYRSAPKVKRKWNVDVQSLPLGVDESFFSVEQRAYPAIKRLLYIGRLDASKHVDWLANFFFESGLAQRGYCLEIVGDGPLHDSLVQRHGGAENIVFHGRKNRQEVVSILCQAYALLHPSDHESFGLTILEAMAAGVPVITHELSSIAIWAGQCARYADHLDRASWLQALKTLEQEDEWRRVSASGKELAKSFTWERVVQQIFVCIGIDPAALDQCTRQ